MYHRWVLKKALSLSSDPHTASDIVQGTWLRAWSNRHAVRDITAFGRWVEVICQREAWMVLRQSHAVEPLGEESHLIRVEHDLRIGADRFANEHRTTKIPAGLGRTHL